jgi:ABC-type dipeptide/oligopeptide/nickel transport system ATPase component
MSLNVENLTVYYQTLKGPVQALEDASFSMRDGEIMWAGG